MLTAYIFVIDINHNTFNNVRININFLVHNVDIVNFKYILMPKYYYCFSLCAVRGVGKREMNLFVASSEKSSIHVNLHMAKTIYFMVGFFHFVSTTKMPFT